MKTRPRAALRVALVQAPVYDRSTPNNGIALLCAHLKRAGHLPLVLDASIPLYRELSRRLKRDLSNFADFRRAVEENKEIAFESVDRDVARLAAWKPDVVGFSVMAGTEEWSLEMASRLKRLAPSSRVVFGGPQCLRENLAFDFIRRAPVDCVVIGEADVSFPRLLAEFDPKAGELPVLPGILVRRAGGIADGGDGPAVEDLDTLPFLDFSGFDMTLYSGDRIHLSTSRGCVRKCAFCAHIVQQKVYRTMSAARAVAEIRHQLAEYPERRVVDFNDSLVNGDVRRVAEISELLIQLRAERLQTHPGIDFGWTGMAILHPTMTPGLLQKMRWSGCLALRYGLESGSQKVVDRMRKNFKVADAVKIIRDTSRAGIEPHVFVMAGFPGETERDFRMTLDFVRRNARLLGGVLVSNCEIQEGSDLDVRAADYGIRLPLTDRVRWRTEDGTNTYEVRRDRVERLLRLVDEVRIDFSRFVDGRTGRLAAAAAALR
jgi:radical SAM superfamily enzyme YgiQ (UPF0313 family)